MKVLSIAYSKYIGNNDMSERGRERERINFLIITINPKQKTKQLYDLFAKLQISIKSIIWYFLVTISKYSNIYDKNVYEMTFFCISKQIVKILLCNIYCHLKLYLLYY